MKKAFTLVELLVVIAIIALLSTLSVVALNSARAKSRDARRLSDIKNIQTALEMYFDTAGEYPTILTAGGELSYGGLVFLAKVPSDPISSNQYNYAQTESGQSYTLDFTVESKAGDYEAGSYQATPNGILAGGGETPPEEFVCGAELEDGTETYSTKEIEGFCIMISNLNKASHERRCYGDDPQACGELGGLYSYSQIDGLCPAGWRLLKLDQDPTPVLGELPSTERQGFKGFHNKGDDAYVSDKAFLMVDSSTQVLNVDSKDIEAIPSENSSVSVRCIKDPV